MSPTIYRWRGYRFFFFSREEVRPHVHVRSPEGEAKFWLTPEVALASDFGLSQHDLNEICAIVQEQRDAFLQAWREHFRS